MRRSAADAMRRGSPNDIVTNAPDFPRSKQDHRILWGSSYRAVHAAIRVFGQERVLRAVVDSAWVLRRYGVLLTGGVFGEELRGTELALTPELLLSVIPSGGRVLDVGAGVGRWTAAASLAASEVVAVEHDPDAVARLRARGLTGVVVDDRDAGRGLADLGEFDVAILSHVLEHLDDPEALLAELGGSCRTLVIEVPDRESDPLNYARLRLGRPYYTDGDHVREYTGAVLDAQLAATGWRPVTTRHRWGALAVVAVREPAP